MDIFWIVAIFLTGAILILVIPASRYYAETDEQKAFVIYCLFAFCLFFRNQESGALLSTQAFFLVAPHWSSL